MKRFPAAVRARGVDLPPTIDGSLPASMRHSFILRGWGEAYQQTFIGQLQHPHSS